MNKRIEKDERKLSKLHPVFAGKVREVLSEARSEGLEVGIVYGFRSFSFQDGLYARGRTTEGKTVTKARGGFSWHNYGLAADIVFYAEGMNPWDEHHPWRRLGKLIKERRLIWGGDWGWDFAHCEWHPGWETRQIRLAYEIYDRGGIKDVWKRIDDYRKRDLMLTAPMERGEEILRVQKRLRALGYPAGNPDGIFGPRTGRAVKAFQIRNGLPADGTVDSRTRDALFSCSAIPDLNGGK